MNSTELLSFPAGGVAASACWSPTSDVNIHCKLLHTHCPSSYVCYHCTLCWQLVCLHTALSYVVSVSSPHTVLAAGMVLYNCVICYFPSVGLPPGSQVFRALSQLWPGASPNSRMETNGRPVQTHTNY